MKVRFFGWIGCVILVCAGCGGEPQMPAGHRQMVEVLEGIAQESLETSLFIGEGATPTLKAALDVLPDDVRGRQRWALDMQLGNNKLRLGLLEEAIAHYEAAIGELAEFEGGAPRLDVLKTTFTVGAAYMRVTQTENCVRNPTPDSCIFPIREGGVHENEGAARNAVRYLTRVLDADPEDPQLQIKSRWLLNIAYMMLGEYPDAVPGAYLIAPEALASEEEFPRFADIAPKLGLDAYNISGGIVADDLDGDGLLDLMVTTSDSSGQMSVFRNNGDGTFTDRTAEAGLLGLLGALNMVQADYDNDGDIDVLALRGAWRKDLGLHPNSLLQNDGSGNFTDVTFDAGIGETFFPTQTADWADYDNDGDLDLYVGAENGGGVEQPNQLFRNEGDGTFTDVTAQAGVEDLRYTKAVSWGDYDGDRLPDIYVSNLGGENRLYHNNGDGTFTDVAPAAGVTEPISCFPTWFWDVNNDGSLDIYAAAYGGPQSPGTSVADVAWSYLGVKRPESDTDRLYLGDGRGGFANVATEWNLVRVTLPMGANYGDLDNDGYPDFYLGTGYPYHEALMPNVMYRNRRGTGFADITSAGGFGTLAKGHGIAFADLDNDGDQDVFEELGGAYPVDAYYNALYENPGFGNHWIKIGLVGVQSNRSGIGARIRADVVDGGERRSIYKQVSSGGAFGANPLRKEIGLGKAEKIELLEIYWPASDRTQTFRDVAVDQWIEVTEDRDTYETRPLRKFSF